MTVYIYIPGKPMYEMLVGYGVFVSMTRPIARLHLTDRCQCSGNVLKCMLFGGFKVTQQDKCVGYS